MCTSNQEKQEDSNRGYFLKKLWCCVVWGVMFGFINSLLIRELAAVSKEIQKVTFRQRVSYQRYQSVLIRSDERLANAPNVSF